MKKKILIIVIIAGFIGLGIFTLTQKIDKNKVNTEWTITQYGSNQMPQMMCFTIEGNENGLVVVDGGYEDNNEQVETILSIAKNHNNKIDAWIITHLDSDHVGVFLNIINNHPEVKIKNIYTSNVPTLEQAKEKAPWETEWEPYERFTSLQLDNIHYLYENDEIENLIGLKLKVLWAYSDWIYDYSLNLLNNGSLVFKIYGNEETMLFCADIQDSIIENKLLENHKNDISSDYLQVAHHGNNKFSKDFYNLVLPKIAFFAAPKDLIYNVDNVNWYTARTIKEWLESAGAIIYTHETAPNSIIIK